MNKKINIAIVDDHEIFRDGLALMLKREPLYQVIMHAKNGIDLVKKINGIDSLKPDIVLLDMVMPEMNGIETTRWIKKHIPAAKIIILTMIDIDDRIVEAVQAGVDGYLLKSADREEINKAFNEVLKGRTYFHDFIKDSIIHALRQPVSANAKKQPYQQIWEELKEQERNLLALCCSDLTYAEIARKLKMSSSVIEAMRQGLFSRFKVKSRVGLALILQKYYETEISHIKGIYDM
jgi:two-component system invasion response regulator UvrY